MLIGRREGYCYTIADDSGGGREGVCIVVILVRFVAFSHGVWASFVVDGRILLSDMCIGRTGEYMHLLSIFCFELALHYSYSYSNVRMHCIT